MIRAYLSRPVVLPDGTIADRVFEEAEALTPRQMEALGMVPPYPNISYEHMPHDRGTGMPRLLNGKNVCLTFVDTPDHSWLDGKPGIIPIKLGRLDDTVKRADKTLLTAAALDYGIPEAVIDGAKTTRELLRGVKNLIVPGTDLREYEGGEFG